MISERHLSDRTTDMENMVHNEDEEAAISALDRVMPRANDPSLEPIDHINAKPRLLATSVAVGALGLTLWQLLRRRK